MPLFRDIEGNFFDIPKDDLDRYRVERELSGDAEITGQEAGKPEEGSRNAGPAGKAYFWDQGRQGAAAYNYQGHAPAYNYEPAAYNYAPPGAHGSPAAYNYAPPAAYNYEGGAAYNYAPPASYNYAGPQRAPAAAYNYAPPASAHFGAPRYFWESGAAAFNHEGLQPGGPWRR
ncbi:MAG TPA: hypothetical protein VGK45_13470 [Thermoanaerobaculia bacterium]|jgi:hypothetical protein